MTPFPTSEGLIFAMIGFQKVPPLMVSKYQRSGTPLAQYRTLLSCSAEDHPCIDSSNSMGDH
jgi:hypothetical protein